MTFWQSLKSAYRGSISFLVACPLLALVPVIFELLQHVVEVRIGMYDSLEAAKAVEQDPLRVGFGLLKVAALTLPGYWIVRFLVSRSPQFAASFDPVAARLFSIFFLFNLALAALQLFALPQTGIVVLTSFLVGMIIAVLVAAWGVAAALGNSRIGPVQSVAIMARQLPWTFAYFVVVMMPLMIPHYAFAGLAILGPHSLVWPILIFDSLLVGWLTAVMVSANYFAAERASQAAGIKLSAMQSGEAVPQ